MSDSSYEFGTVIKAPRDAMDWLAQKLDDLYAEDDEESIDSHFIIERDPDDPTEILVSTLNGCSFEALSILEDSVCEMQRKFGLEEPWHLTYSEISTDGKQWYTNGGAVVCYKGKATHMLCAERWASETTDRLLKEQTENNT